MISVTQAKAVLTEHCERGSLQKVSLEESLGYILAASVISPIEVPSFDNSAMDGYAMRYDGKENEWQLGPTIQAGEATTTLVKEWQAARIFTGAMMPEGTDTVIPQELVELNDDGNSVCYEGDKIQKGSNVRLRGSQCRKGDLLVHAGTVITPGIIGLLASVGVGEVSIYKPPSVACIITGDELKEVGEGLRQGEIYNSNGPMLQACLRQLGIEKIELLRALDDKEKLQQLINDSLQKFDVLLLSGGISVGDYDFVKECLEQAGVKELFYKVKQRPGKPFFAGKKGQQWIFALPGNPASVLSCFQQYVKPCLNYMMGQEQVWEPDEVLEVKEDLKKKQGLTFFMKAKRESGKVRILGGQQSFNLLSFSEADCLVELEEEEELVRAGTKVNVYNLK